MTENAGTDKRKDIDVCDICGAETEVVHIVYASSTVKYCRAGLLDVDLNDAT